MRRTLLRCSIGRHLGSADKENPVHGAIQHRDNTYSLAREAAHSWIWADIERKWHHRRRRERGLRYQDVCWGEKTRTVRASRMLAYAEHGKKTRGHVDIAMVQPGPLGELIRQWRTNAWLYKYKRCQGCNQAPNRRCFVNCEMLSADRGLPRIWDRWLSSAPYSSRWLEIQRLGITNNTYSPLDDMINEGEWKLVARVFKAAHRFLMAGEY